MILMESSNMKVNCL